MNMPKLFFLVESPFSERDWDRFGISDLLERFDVQVHDLTPINNLTLWERNGSIQIKSDRVITHFSTQSISESITGLRPSASILNLGEGELRSILIRLLKKRRVLTAEFQLGAMPGPQTSQMTPIERIEFRLKQSRSPLQLLSSARVRWRRYRDGNDLPDVFFRGGRMARGRHPDMGQEVIDVHSLDFEAFRESSRPTPTQVTRKVIYLDQDIGFHSDLRTLRMRSPATPSIFYGELNSYFDWLEETFGVKVVICPHPRANRADTPTRFPSREISELLTSQEIFGSRVVLGHVSTSFSFAVLAERPTQILTTSELSSSWYGPYLERFSSELRAPLINLSDPSTWLEPLSELSNDQRSAYSEYTKNYLNNRDGDHGRLWTSVGDELLKRTRS